MSTDVAERERVEHAEEPARKRGWRRWASAAALIVLAVVAAFVLGRQTSGDDGETVSPEVRELHAEWVAAWNAEDGEAVVSLMLPRGRHYCPATGDAGVSGDQLASFVERGWQMTDVEIVSVTTSPASALVGHAGHDYVVVSELTLNDRPGYVSVLHLAGPEGVLGVHQHITYP